MSAIKDKRTTKLIVTIATAIILIMMLPVLSVFPAFSADNYIVLQGFAFDINSQGEAVIHGYDDRFAEVVIPQRLMGADVALIDDYAFFGDEVLMTVSFNRADKLKKIGANAFYGCKGLRSIDIPPWIEELSFGSFQNCTSLNELVLREGIATIPSQCFYNCTALQRVEIPNSVTAIGDRAFMGCSQLSSVTIPDTVESIAGNAFDGCENVVINCTKDSFARQYAEENKIAYVVTDADMFILGDANGDAVVNINDVTSIQCHLVELESIMGLSLQAADTNQDGVLDVSDATNLQMFLAEYDVSNPIREVIIQ